jgi:hypothetical protein
VVGRPDRPPGGATDVGQHHPRPLALAQHRRQEVALYAADAADLLRSETYLLDPANKKKHFVVTDAGGRPIGTDIGMSFRVKPKESYAAWAKFPAPPAGIEKITVVIAKTPPFEDVAIGK